MVRSESLHLYTTNISFVVANDSELESEIPLPDCEFDIVTKARQFVLGTGKELPKAISLPGDYFIFYVCSLAMTMRERQQESLTVCLGDFLKLWARRSTENPFKPSSFSAWQFDNTVESLRRDLEKQGIEITCLLEAGTNISHAMLLLSSCS
ncbi:MAG: hypothetical protein COU65_03450 [Candidatus Pacebacteria bacterium CG10_big_fil_rev_8_21_14_0_10_42_12]|nr:MAG: hypothetical protein COU65_03450 [Candidatus Pacebacteria bacterium CG10_big_fil_rev_8_21_14_0_10_42_12]